MLDSNDSMGNVKNNKHSRKKEWHVRGSHSIMVKTMTVKAGMLGFEYWLHHLLTSYVTLGELLNFCMAQFPHL